MEEVIFFGIVKKIEKELLFNFGDFIRGVDYMGTCRVGLRYIRLVLKV